MNIIHVINHTHRHNGNVHAAVDLACAQTKLGHSITICSSGGDFDDVLLKNNVQIVNLQSGRSAASVLNNIKTIRHLLKERSADIVHAHMMQSALVARMACILKPIMVTSVHNAFQPSSILMALGDRVIAVSGEVGAQLLRRGVPGKRLRVVLNGTIGSARYPSVMPNKEMLIHPAFLYVGGLHPRKGIPDLLSGMAIARKTRPDFHLYLVGEGPMEQEYKELVEVGDREHIHFVGSRKDPRGYLRSADVFVLASHADPAPLVVSEAREAGLAVIGTAVDGIPELLENGQAGTLVSPQDPYALAAAMLTVAETPDTLSRHRLAGQFNLDRMSLERVALETVAVYRELKTRSRQSKEFG